MKSLRILAVLVGLAGAPAFAQQNTPAAPTNPTPCWEVVAPPQGIAPGSLIKLNKCTGETWLLVRIRLSEPDAPGIQSTYTFRWQRLMQDDTGEAALASRAGPP